MLLSYVLHVSMVAHSMTLEFHFYFWQKVLHKFHLILRKKFINLKLEIFIRNEITAKHECHNMQLSVNGIIQS